MPEEPSPPASLKTTPSFRDLTLIEAERAIVAACADYEHALRTALRILPLDDFRSEQAEDLRSIFYALAGRLERRVWERSSNRFLIDLAYGSAYSDDLWCPYAMFGNYVEALCRAVRDSNALLDEAIATRTRWRDENPLAIHNHTKPQRTITLRGLNI